MEPWHGHDFDFVLVATILDGRLQCAIDAAHEDGPGITILV